jgi:hypothetical protein
MIAQDHYLRLAKEAALTPSPAIEFRMGPDGTPQPICPVFAPDKGIKEGEWIERTDDLLDQLSEELDRLK